MNNLPVNLPSSIPQFSIDSLDVETVKVGMIIFLVFVVMILMAIGRHYLISSSLQGVWAGFIMGILVIAGIEGGVFYTYKTYVNGEKANLLPKNVQAVLNDSQHGVNQVLGLKTERQQPTAQSVVSDFSLLSPLDLELVHNSVCKDTNGSSTR